MTINLETLMNKAKEIESVKDNIEVIGESGAGIVKIFMNGKFIVKKIKFDNDEMLKEKEFLEDLLMAAFNDAVKKVEEKNKNSITNFAQNFKFPFNT